MHTDKHSWKQNHTLQGAIVLAKLDRFDHELAQRQTVARRYQDRLTQQEESRAKTQSRQESKNNQDTSRIQ